MIIKRRTKSAYSLLELLVASAIFAGMIVAATAALSAVSSLHAKEQASYEVTNYTQSLMRQISQQVSHASSVQASNNLLVITKGKVDQYGRTRWGTSDIVGYCTYYNFLRTKQNIPQKTGGYIPDDAGCTNTSNILGNPNKYTVTLSASSLTSNSVRISLTVKGSIGGGEVRSGSSLANGVSFTESAVVEYQNTSPNNLPYSQETTQ